MTTISIPQHINPFQTMESTPARALTFATNLRVVSVGVKNAQGWAADNAAADWQGVAADTHDHAMTRFARRLDAPEAALEGAVTAADLFQERLGDLRAQRPLIEQSRQAVNEDIVLLRAEISAAPDDSRLEEFEQRAKHMAERVDVVRRAITRWEFGYVTAEVEFIASLAEVDTIAEGAAARTDPNRPDVETLERRLRSVLGDPMALAAWWRTLNRAQKQALITEHPKIVGNADGVPASDRDEANRAGLYHDIDYLQRRVDDGQASDAQRAALDNARHLREQINGYRNTVDADTGRELLHLLVFKPGAHSGDGGVAISFGDPDTADHVSVNVPGLTSDSSSTEANLAKTMKLHAAIANEDNGSVASIYWLDYDAPSGNPFNPLDPMGRLDFAAVAFADRAATGGETFSDFVGGLHASDTGCSAHVTAIGHSYGSTAVGHALRAGVSVDDAILIGSPGQPAATALDLTGADVWVGAKDNDPVSLLGSGGRGGVGALGHDPAQASFGARRFETGDGSLRIQDLIGNHMAYFKGESLENMAEIAAGKDDEVTERAPRGGPGGEYRTLEELTVSAATASGGEWLQDSASDTVRFFGSIGETLVSPFRRHG